MTFADIYLYFVLAAPYAVLPFIAIWFALRWKSGWSMELPGTKVVGGLALSALLATLVVSGINFAISLAYPDPVLFMQHEVLPVGGLTTLVYSVTGVAVSVLVWIRLKADITAFMLES